MKDVVKRIAVVFPDQSISLMSPVNGEAAAIARARRETATFNKGESDPAELAQFGEIEVDLMSFKQRF